MKKTLPIILILIGLLTGGGAGFILQPAVEDKVGEASEGDDDSGSEIEELDDAALLALEPTAFVKISNQFVVPVVDEIRVNALVVLSISLRVGELETEAVYNREPLLRDAFLQVLFDHAYIGGFDGVYTASTKMSNLKTGLLRAAQEISGESVKQILITDIVRQDL